MMNNPIRHIRKLLTPPCSTCKHYSKPLFGESQPCCRSNKYLDREERISGRRYERAMNTLVRGTRFCTYERREEDEQ